MKYSLHPKAERELADAAQFYRRESGLKLANAFVSELEKVAAQLVLHPTLGITIAEGLRMHVFRRFPYVVIYRVLQNEIRILVVAHQRRKPNYWRGRA